NALAMGILVFLITDVLSHAWDPAKLLGAAAFTGKGPVADVAIDLLALFGGLGLGLLGLALYEQRYLRRIISTKKKLAISEENNRPGASNTPAKPDTAPQQHGSELFSNPHHLATMIAVGIGLHNFSEGLAIGQSFASGAIALAVLLIVGFGAHNATEGFGIAGPLTGLVNKPKVRFLILLGLIGGGPTFIGTIIGSLWTSNIASILFLSVAGGALIYVSMLMYNSGRKQTTNSILMIGIFVGLFAGFTTDLMIALAGA